MVMEIATKKIMSTAIMVNSQEGLGLLRKNVTTSSQGEFWRLLMPGGFTHQCFQLELFAFRASEQDKVSKSKCFPL